MTATPSTQRSASKMRPVAKQRRNERASPADAPPSKGGRFAECMEREAERPKAPPTATGSTEDVAARSRK